MTAEELRGLLERVRTGELGTGEAMRQLQMLDVEDLGFAHVDHHRRLRKGFPEVILCEGKTPEQVREIARSLRRRGGAVAATRASRGMFEAVREVAPEAQYHEAAGVVAFGDPPPSPDDSVGPVLIATGGTADIPVAEEAAVTAELMGARVERLWDVGVAGIHRVLEHRDVLLAAEVVVVVAGMEGALASVLGGLVDKPVVAVPASTGYGASFGGVAALLGMLNSCASGVVVVNIDNGFGAGFFAGMLVRQIARARKQG
ncbi:MAG: nickel pincer cofactor biosynthesis protein LarB [Armatimonadota bacterium]|jgi:NCAIR mutase (PurE)-related protein